jgi:hypothetical protein
MDDEDLKKSVIDQMMGEVDDVTAGDLKKKGPVKGVEIAITVSPHSEDMPEEECDEDGCVDPVHEHDHEAVGEIPEDAHNEEDGYINQLLKKLG